MTPAMFFGVLSMESCKFNNHTLKQDNPHRILLSEIRIMSGDSVSVDYYDGSVGWAINGIKMGIHDVANTFSNAFNHFPYAISKTVND